jgi:multidrug resistance efflux pump
VRLRASLAAAGARRREMQAEVARAEAVEAQRVVRAPADGRVLSLAVRPGEAVGPETPIGDFAPEGPLETRCEVDELYAPWVRVGQPAFVRTLGGRDSLAAGTIVYASPALKRKSLFAETADEAEDRRVREVRVRLAPDANRGGRLLLNARVECVVRTTGAGTAVWGRAAGAPGAV